jgi:hypothetical protein
VSALLEEGKYTLARFFQIGHNQRVSYQLRQFHKVGDICGLLHHPHPAFRLEGRLK